MPAFLQGRAFFLTTFVGLRITRLAFTTQFCSTKSRLPC